MLTSRSVFWGPVGVEWGGGGNVALGNVRSDQQDVTSEERTFEKYHSVDLV